jgi:hypothetical protein
MSARLAMCGGGIWPSTKNSERASFTHRRFCRTYTGQYSAHCWYHPVVRQIILRYVSSHSVVCRRYAGGMQMDIPIFDRARQMRIYFSDIAYARVCACA